MERLLILTSICNWLPYFEKKKDFYIFLTTKGQAYNMERMVILGVKIITLQPNLFHAQTTFVDPWGIILLKNTLNVVISKTYVTTFAHNHLQEPWCK